MPHPHNGRTLVTVTTRRKSFFLYRKKQSQVALRRVRVDGWCLARVIERDPLCDRRGCACILGSLQTSSPRACSSVRSGSFAKVEPPRAFWAVCRIIAHVCTRGVLQNLSPHVPNLSPRVHLGNCAETETTRAAIACALGTLQNLRPRGRSGNFAKF